MESAGGPLLLYRPGSTSSWREFLKEEPVAGRMTAEPATSLAPPPLPPKPQTEEQGGEEKEHCSMDNEAMQQGSLKEYKPPPQKKQSAYFQMNLMECGLNMEIPFVYTGKRTEVVWKEAGVSLFFPRATHCKEAIRFSVKVVNDDYVLPQEYQGMPLVSSMYEITASDTLPSPVRVRIEHCAVVEKEDELVFVVAHGDPPYNFKPLPGGHFPLNELYGEISTKKFSIFTILQNIRDWNMQFSVRIFQCRNSTADFVVTKDIPEHRTIVKENYKDVTEVVEFTTICSFLTDAITLAMPPPPSNGWSVKPFVEPAKISMDKIHVYKQGSTIPSIKLMVRWEGTSQPKEDTVSIRVQGGDFESFHLPCKPPEPPPLPPPGVAPQLSNLTCEMSVLAWSDARDMAIQLGVDYATLTNIEYDFTVGNRLSAAMNAWLTRDCRASWKKVVKALRAIRQDVLAEKIRKSWVQD